MRSILPIKSEDFLPRLSSSGSSRRSQTQATPQERTKNLIVLVFRDGHRMEIQNYAIVGQTLWVFEERVATKILLSDLDLDATQRENRGSGLRLPSQEK